ncbi:KGK domain-containing protein [Chroogloeocystis siderophila]|jgi:hypothetical protein|uniref:KGK domain-containing protein n=1 Tax=Chroogloeocystis siderophila 5.2 s.c.1 TaxID=247279 RepID=A0A1U7HXV7_9CHRO|nr:KGK domain-containing protein [Chroogloeocystis siderophila]OKH28447.1 hypothetical protein NIES1031_04210 [Chroogloeocystis siderophila 5.2 s.c.1]
MNKACQQMQKYEVIYNSFSLPSLSITFKVGEMLRAIKSYINHDNINKLLDKGLEVEVLHLDAKGWKKGRIKFTLEFCPDKSEGEDVTTSSPFESNEQKSSLDDIRKMINEKS